MKILLFGFPRTRSSLLQDVLCKHFNLKNLWEPYENIRDKIKSIKITSTDLWNSHKLQVIETTELLENDSNFVAKCFACYGFNIYKTKHDLPIFWEKGDFLDLSYFKLNMYDKIYCTYRTNYTDMICSYRFMKNFSSPFYRIDHKNDLKNKEMHSRQKIIIPYDVKTAYLDCIEKIIYDCRINQFKKLNYNFLELEYNEIPKYIEKNLSNVQSKYVESEFDYKKRVRNYSEIDDKIKKTFEELEPVKKQIELLFS